MPSKLTTILVGAGSALALAACGQQTPPTADTETTAGAPSEPTVASPPPPAETAEAQAAPEGIFILEPGSNPRISQVDIGTGALVEWATFTPPAELGAVIIPAEFACLQDLQSGANNYECQALFDSNMKRVVTRIGVDGADHVVVVSSTGEFWDLTAPDVEGGYSSTVSQPHCVQFTATDNIAYLDFQNSEEIAVVKSLAEDGTIAKVTSVPYSPEPGNEFSGCPLLDDTGTGTHYNVQGNSGILSETEYIGYTFDNDLVVKTIGSDEERAFLPESDFSRQDFSPVPNPAGDTVAFFSRANNDAPIELFTASLDGGEPQRIAELPGLAGADRILAWR